MRKLLVAFFVLTLTACSTRPVVSKATASVLADNKVSFKGSILDHDALMQLKQETLSDEEWTNVLPVMIVTDNMEDAPEAHITGTYAVNDTTIIFTAQKPFAKHIQYVARFYASDSGLSYLKPKQSKESLKGLDQTIFNFKRN